MINKIKCKEESGVVEDANMIGDERNVDLYNILVVGIFS